MKNISVNLFNLRAEIFIMNLKLLNILRCPACKSNLICHSEKADEKGSIIEGSLECSQCHKNYPIIRSIPRFVSMDNYATSFGYQWNLYKYTQVDKFSKTSHSEKRFFAETKWSKESVNNNWILEVGCGNGRFIDVCSSMDCQVVGVDISSAIDAAGELFQDRENVHLIQASIYELPFADGVFDKCYSIGVIQHTPDPKQSINALPKLIKKDGQIALTIYERRPWTPFYGKYVVRRLTKRLNKKVLLSAIKLASPILFPVTEILFKIPVLKNVFKFIIPYANYTDMTKLSIKQRYEWAILDTFDMLSPAYDSPMTEASVRKCLENSRMKNIRRLANPGVNMIAVK